VRFCSGFADGIVDKAGMARKLSEKDTRKEMIDPQQSFRPFGFLANGYDIYFVETGISAKRLVNGFFTGADLENLLFIRQNGQKLGDTPTNPGILDRAYQYEAIRRVSLAFEKGKRKALLLEKRKLDAADLYEPPLMNFGADALERWFTEKEVDEIVEFAKQLAIE
jgi:hypothetical protein